LVLFDIETSSFRLADDEERTSRLNIISSIKMRF
jgi:hypothetical protein